MAQTINRVHEALLAWKKMEENNVNLISPEAMASSELARLKLNRLDKVAASLSFTTNAEEKDSLQLLAIMRRQLIHVAYPDGQGLRRALSWLIRPIKFFFIRKASEQKHNRELAKIQDTMQRAGFGKYVYRVFEKIRQGERNFSLPTSVRVKQNEQTYFNLRFSFDDVKGYAFDGFQANFRNSLSPGLHRQHTFNSSEKTISAKQAENLIAGRAILETFTENGRLNQRWVKLDTIKDEKGDFLVKHFSPDVFDTQKNCEKLPFWKTINPFEKLHAVGKLLSGQRATVNIDYRGKALPIHIEADPESQVIKVFDEKGKLMDLKKIGQNQIRTPQLKAGIATAKQRSRSSKQTGSVSGQSRKTKKTVSH